MPLLPYLPAHFAALSALQLPPAQESFTAYPADLIPAAEADPDSLGVSILDGEDVVGYFVLSAGAQRDKYLPAPDPAGVAIRALSIDERCQGRGIGTAAMMQAAEVARQHFPQATYLFLVVNQRNAHARRVYDKAGFTDWFVRDGGEHGPQWVLRRELDQEKR
ncbi:GNAT family N-acetyltransferase [Deinococcus piscis]|nr:GNAT family N-acetyltransferase [Deinococcus piscis]